MAFAMECERAEKLAGADTLTEAQAREILADILKRTASGEVLNCPSISGYFREWLTNKKSTTAGSTVTRYTKAVDEFLKHIADRANKPLTSLTSRQVESFVMVRSKAGLSPSTVTLDAKVLRTALNKARKQGLISTNPADAIDLPANDAVERGAFTPAEVKMLVSEAKDEWKTLIQLAYFTGARLSDCVRMEWEAVDFSKGTLTYTQGKTGVTVPVPIHPVLDAHLNKLAGSDKPEKFIMPGMADKGPGGRHGLSESFKTIMRKAGVDSQKVVRDIGVRTLSRRTFHALRHSFTSALANAGVAPELRMKLTGHTTEAAHRGYTHHELETLRAAISKLPDIT